MKWSVGAAWVISRARYSCDWRGAVDEVISMFMLGKGKGRAQLN